MPPKLDDAPWKDEDPVERDRRYARARLQVQLFRGGATQLAKCPDCLALVEESDLKQHQSLLHDGGST